MKKLPVWKAAYIIVSVLSNKYQPSLPLSDRHRLAWNFTAKPREYRANWMEVRYELLKTHRVPEEVMAQAII